MNEPEVIELDEDTPEEEIDSFFTQLELDIQETSFTVFEWHRRLQRGDIIVDPDFQRNLVWTQKQKIRFIESILLNIPLPPLYVNLNVTGKYILIDGLQRTTTLKEFFDGNFSLSAKSVGDMSLPLLSRLEGKKFSDLSSQLQARIEDKKLLLYVIKPNVPITMVYEIFSRINTGGTQLNRQEVRNCLYIGNATRLLGELAKSAEFNNAVAHGVSDKRMKGREIVLRYLAFRYQDHSTYNGMDEFLVRMMKMINLKSSDDEIAAMKSDFLRVMNWTLQIFGEANFRIATESTRGTINIAVFESVSHFISLQSDSFLEENKRKIEANFKKLLQNPDYLNSVKTSTGDFARVEKRFELAKQILGEI